MEPFFLRCETCQARLRVRDERFLGQVQSCPKCGSMVQIVAPAGWLAAGEVTPVPEVTEVAASGSATIGAKVVEVLRQHAILLSAGGTAIVLAGGLIGMLLLGGDDEVAALPTNANTAVAAVDTQRPEIQQDETLIEVEVSIEEVPSQISKDVVTNSPAPVAFLPLETPAPDESSTNPTESAPPQTASEPAAEPTDTRTLTLEVIEPVIPDISEVNQGAEPPVNYPPVDEVAEVEIIDGTDSGVAQPPAAERPSHVTNIVDQLSVPIESIELPAMPIGEFVHLISEMSAVPIKLDPKVLGDVGLSSKTKVIVKGGDISLGKLLARARGTPAHLRRTRRRIGCRAGEAVARVNGFPFLRKIGGRTIVHRAVDFITSRVETLACCRFSQQMQ